MYGKQQKEMNGSVRIFLNEEELMKNGGLPQMPQVDKKVEKKKRNKERQAIKVKTGAHMQSCT